MTSPDRATFRLIPFASSAAFILLAALAFLAAGGPDASAQTGMATADVCPMDQGPDSLTDFARKCDVAVGETVPSFNCDDGTPVPENHLTGTYPAAFCDAPNVLHGVCDPGSRFQVLKETNTAAIVAHCRKQGNAPHVYGDIAVIQYNKSNGAICFYQALGLLPAAVSAPSDGNGPGKFPWFDPPHTAAYRGHRMRRLSRQRSVHSLALPGPVAQRGEKSVARNQPGGRSVGPAFQLEPDLATFLCWQ